MRKSLKLMEGWRFTGLDGKQQMLSLPHTWNALDGQDGGNNYARGTCLYETSFPIPSFDAEQECVYLEFRGVNSSAQVTLNGAQLMSHDGGYSTFRKEITALLKESNELCVSVDNSVNTKVYPQKADFTFYGGIYRDVLLRIVPRNHFELDYLGGEGLKITPAVEGKDGRIHIETWHKVENAFVTVSVLDAEGAVVASGEGTDVTLTVSDIHLWDGLKDPYLYTAKAELIRDGQVLDTVSSHFGVRTFRFDPNEGFFLNGRSYPLRGVCRHQDWKGIGNAITEENHDQDIEIIREVGANTVRLAHYQHDQHFYDLCDKYGFVVWAEIPYISEHMPDGRENTVSQMKELITQNYNHPCIVTWGLSNEITISTKNTKDMLENHRILNELVHEMDPTRPTTLACYAMCNPFWKVVHVSDIVAYNLYLGWYVPGMFLNDWFLKFFHWKWPNRCIGYSEYGAEAMPNLHSSKPRRGDHTEEYQAIYHEYMIKCFERHPFMWGTYCWNMFDFAADARDQGGEPGMNHKGLVTFDRKIKKDSFYLYKAYWSDEPFVHICSKRFTDRVEDEITVKIYSNQKTIALYAGDKKIGEQTGDKVFTFKVPTASAGNLRAVSGELTDEASFRKVSTPNPDYKVRKGKSANWV